jgi:hypothetical protein
VTKTIEEVRKQQTVLRAAYHRWVNSPDAVLPMEDLYQRFNGTTLKHHEGLIDPYASLAAGGCREVLLYIELMTRDKNATTK